MLSTSTLFSSTSTMTEILSEAKELVQQREFTNALVLLNNASEKWSYNLPIEGLKADCYRAVGDSHSSIKCYENIIASTCQCPFWVHVGYANVLEDEGKKTASIKQMEVAISKRYSFDLATRIVRMLHLQPDANSICQSVANACLASVSLTDPDDIYRLGEYLVSEGRVDVGRRLMETVVKKDIFDPKPIQRIVKILSSAGNVEQALRVVEEWKENNPADTRLNDLYETCKDASTLTSKEGMPCITVELESDLDGYDLFINNFRVNAGVRRYAHFVSAAERDKIDDSIQPYVVVIPECLIDSNDETYIFAIKEREGKKREFSQEYLSRKIVKSNVGMEVGSIEYQGDSQIRGWYINHFDKCCSLSLYLNGEFMQEISLDQDRFDVSDVHGKEVLNCGFELSWDENIFVTTLEIRNSRTDRAVLSTPMHVHRLEKSIDELENALLASQNRLSRNIGHRGLGKIFESMRTMPSKFVEPSPAKHIASRDLECGVSVIIPVYNGLEEIKACLQSISVAGCKIAHEIICINDASPDAAVLEFLSEFQGKEDSVFIINSDINRGFVKSVNKGIQSRRYRDVVLLNSDTIVPENFIDRLKSAHELDESFGVITPLSNNATIFSFPLTLENNKLRNHNELRRIDQLLKENSSGKVFNVPTGHGYCMFVSSDVLESVGLLDEDEWGVGYGEENDFCQKVKMHGWRIGAYYGMYVGHVGSVSFGDQKREAQVAVNAARLNEIYPEYDRTIQGFISNESESRIARNRLQLLNWISNSGRKNILFVSHSLGGGTSEYIRRCEVELARENIRSIMLTTDKDNLIICDTENDIRCVYRLDEIDILSEHLVLLHPEDVVLNSTFNFPPSLFDTLLITMEKYSIVIHDYSWVCPRVNLIDATGSYCGMPASDVCAKCVEVSGVHTSFRVQWKNINTGLDVWLSKNKQILEGARKIIVPSEDVRNRLRLKYPSLVPSVKYHSDSFVVENDAQRHRSECIEEHVVGIFGMIGDQKGMQLIQKLCWLFSSRCPGIRFVFFGLMSESEWLDGYSNVKCVGEYSEDNLGEYVTREKPTFSLFLSMSPETYCYSLTDSIKHGVYPIAFNLGSFPERIKMHDYGGTIPFETDAESVYLSIVNIITSDDFRSAEINQIKNGVNYSQFSLDYFELSDVGDSSLLEKAVV